MFLVILTALGAVTTISPAQAQLLINLDRAGYPASISTATPHATWHFEWVASGSTSAFCYEPDPVDLCRGATDFVAKQEIDIVWEKYHQIGPPVPNYSSGDLRGDTAIDWTTKKKNDTYRWTGDINGFSANDDRPMLATVHLRKVGTNWTLGSTTSLQFAVNPQITGFGDHATEGTDNNLEFQIALIPRALETITVAYATRDGTAEAGSDYTATSGTLTFSVGQSQKTINVPIINDMVDDSGEHLQLILSNPSGVTRLNRGFAEFTIPAPHLPHGTCQTIQGQEYCNPGGLTPAIFQSELHLQGTIFNDEPGPDDAVDNLPLVSVEATAPYTTEGSDAIFKLTRSGETTDALSVSVSTTETGAMLAGSSATSVSFAAGESEAQLRIATVGDTTVEDDSTVTVALQTGDAYRLGTNESREARIGVLDDDATPPPDGTAGFNGVTVWSANMSVTDYGNGNVGAGSASLLANQRGSEGLQGRWLYYHTGERKLRMAFASDLDTSRLRLKAGDVNLPFPDGTSGDSSFTWEDVDVDWSDGETFEAHLVRGVVAATPAPDPTLKTLTISNATLSPAFNAETVLYTGVVDSNTASVTVSATANDDDATVAFGPNEDADSEAANHQVTVGEGDTLTTVSVTAPDGQTTRTYRVIVRRGRTVAVRFDAATYTATESNSAAAVVVKLNANPTHEITIPLTTTPGGGATAADYSAPGSVTFTSGGALSQTVTVTAVADDTAESGETVAIGFGTLPTWVEAGSRTSTTVTLVDAPATNTAPGGAAQITGTTEVRSTLTAGVSTITDGDGLDNATFEYQWIANDGTSDADIDGATANTYTLVAADAGKTIKVRVTFTDDAGTQETLVSAATTIITSVTLTASFANMPSEHGGGGERNRFTFDLSFSENLELSYKRLRNRAFSVNGAKVKKAQRKVRGSNQNWTITVEPDGWGDVSLTLPGGRACTANNAICTSDNRQLSNSPSATVRGPASLIVADASANENTDDALEFPVTLDRASTLTVTVEYATSDGTATAGADYTATSGTLTFNPGETTQTVSVPVLNDAVDDPGETMTLTLSNAVNAQITDATATGTIENSDPMPKAWTARFGRGVATHLLDALEARLDTTPQSYVRLGGQQLGGTPDVKEAVERLAPDNNLSLWEQASADSANQNMTVKELLLGSAFNLVSNPDESATGPRLSAWGRVATSGFDGEEDRLSLNGTVTTATLGVDGHWEHWLTGVALAYSEGDGSFTQVEAEGGDVDSTLTSIHPYVAYALSDRVRLWGMVGYGSGSLQLRLAEQRALDTDLAMTMGALGVRGSLREPSQPEGGLALALRSDVLWLRMDTAATAGMVATEAEVSRLRLVLEGSRPVVLAAGGSLIPTLEVGLRHDGGDAETGSGVEVGGRLRYTAAWGLSIEASVRGLLAHEASDYREWGASGALRFDPGRQGRGLTASIVPTWGSAASGVNRLWGQSDASGLAVDNALATAAAGRLDAELGYGLVALQGRGLLTPYVRAALAEGDSQAWHLGARLALAASLNFSVEASRRQREGDTAAHELALLATLGW